MYNRILQGLTTEKDAEEFLNILKEKDDLTQKNKELVNKILLLGFCVSFVLVILIGYLLSV